MNVVLAGGSGFLGRALAARLEQDGHVVRTLTRRARPGVSGDVEWQPDGSVGNWAVAIADADLVYNAAGASLADKRWTAARKRVLHESRILPTRSLARALLEAPVRARVLISMSGINVYGPCGDEPVTERTEAADDFLARLVIDWEHAAEAAASPHTAVVFARTGIVLGRDGGALKAMLIPFKLGVGGPMGSGRQYMSWIHLKDWVNLIVHIWNANRAHEGSVARWNLTAPTPVRNAEFARVLGRVVQRPAFLPAPAFALRMLLGDMAEPLLLTGARVLPEKALQSGFQFAFSELEPAIRDALAR